VFPVRYDHLHIKSKVISVTGREVYRCVSCEVQTSTYKKSKVILVTGRRGL
jgi:hypothetical protein